MGNKAGVAGQPEHLCQSAEAGRGWPRLQAALSLLWRWRGVSKLEGEWAEVSLWAAASHMVRRVHVISSSATGPTVAVQSYLS